MNRALATNPSLTVDDVEMAGAKCFRCPNGAPHAHNRCLTRARFGLLKHGWLLNQGGRSEPTGAQCDGGNSVVPRPGYYSGESARRSLFRDEHLPFFKYPPGAFPPVSNISSMLVPRRAEVEEGADAEMLAFEAQWEVDVFPCPPDSCEGGGKCAEGR